MSKQRRNRLAARTLSSHQLAQVAGGWSWGAASTTSTLSPTSSGSGTLSIVAIPPTI